MRSHTRRFMGQDNTNNMAHPLCGPNLQKEGSIEPMELPTHVRFNGRIQFTDTASMQPAPPAHAPLIPSEYHQ